MQIEQIHIPDIPALKSVFKADFSTSPVQAMRDFFAKYWGWIVGILILGITVYVIFLPEKENKENQMLSPQPPDSVNSQNSFKNV